MPYGSGLSSSFGVSKESTYGTRVAPAKFIRVRNADFQREQNRAQGQGITAGAPLARGDHYVETHDWASATVDLDVQNVGMGVLLENLMGTTATVAQQAATIAYLQTHTLGDNYGKSLTMQANVPLRTGTAKAKEINGAKISQATFACGVGEFLTASLTFDGRAYDTSQTLAAPSYVTTNPFHFKYMNFKLGTYASEAAVNGIRSVQVQITRPMDADDFTYNNSGKKVEPVQNGDVEFAITVESDYLATSDFEDRFTGLTSTSMVWEFVGPTAIASTYYPTFRITLPQVWVDGPAMNVAGTDVARTQYTLRGTYDGTNMPKIEYMSTDTAV